MGVPAPQGVARQHSRLEVRHHRVGAVKLADEFRVFVYRGVVLFDKVVGDEI